ncbi:uncharacterized protein JCM15063_005828 [Sporobolomyces koalae]|uniref:uncharacterized protein n=1 Tax=Sporobolomyces koalae TaxID=500713 RepID=UPI00317C731B
MFGATSTGFGGFGQPNQQQAQQQPAQGGGLFGNTSGGFGSSFGASSTPAFGAPAQQPAQNTGFGGFGATTSTTPAFGSAASATPAFGSTPSTGGGLFGSAPATNTANTGFSFGGGGTSAFGSNTNTGTGTTGGGLFGAAKPATTGFGGFGQPAQPAQPQQPAAGGLFGGGAATGGFGATNTFGAGGQVNGTATAPYQATQVLEPPAEEGKPPPASQTAHNFQSITCMPQYKNYSFEELRLQDYQANRKGPTAAPGFGGGFGASSTPAFGAPAAPATGGGLFGSSSTPAFGSTPSAPTTGFGAAPATGGGLFGNTGGTGAFGQPATSQPATGGGLFGSTPAQPATGGLFGSTGGTSAFGQPAQQPAATPAFGGFGAAAQNKPATTGFSFGGASTTTPASTGGGLFGSTPAPTSQPSNPFGQPAAPATGGGLFGSAQPAATSSAPSFSFGASANKPLFGAAATPATSAPAFGAPAAATAPKPFSFGAPATGATGGGLFGSSAPGQSSAPAFGATPAPATGGGLFGGGSTFGQPAQPAAGAGGLGGGLFGAKPAQPAASGGLFGSTTQPSGGLFGSTAQPQAQPQSTSLFGSTAPSGGFGGSLFGGGASTNQQQPGQQQQIAYASSEDPNAYGSNPLFASVGNSPVRPVEEKKKPPIFTAFRGTPVHRSSTKITRLRGFGTASTASPAVANGSPLPFASSLGPSGLSASNGTPARASPLRLGNGLSDDVVLSPNAFVSRPSVKKLVIDRKALGASKGLSTPNKDGSSTPARAKVTFNPEAEVPARSSIFGDSVASRSAVGGDAETSFAVSDLGDSNTTFDSPSLHKTTADWPARRPTNATTSRPKHGDYFTIPSLETLRNFPASKLRSVPDLVVGRTGFGQVAFSQPVDLTTLDTVEDLLGGIVRLEDRNATVYPEEYEDMKPPAGEGLNVPATITLENCFPLDKSTRKPIKDADHPRVQQHVKRLRNLDGTEFVDFEAETGKWTFDVQEF